MRNLATAAMAHGPVWAILPTAGYAALADLRTTDADAHLAEWKAQAVTVGKTTGRVSPDERPYPIQNGVAVLRLDGVMTKKPTSMGAGTSSLLMARSVRMASRDSAAKSVLVVGSSPGGSIEGIDELYQELRALSALKKTTFYIEDGSYSAAYWTACGCSRIVINRTGYTGSLGALMVLEETSDAADKQGVDVRVYSTGPLKGQGTPGTAFSEEFDAMVQNRVDVAGAFFAAAIAEGRGMDPEDVAKVFTGGIFSAQDALALGLVDAIGSLDSAFADLMAQEAEEDAEPIEDDAAQAALAAFLLAERPKASAPAAEPILAAANTISTGNGGEPSPNAGTQRTPNAGSGTTPMNQNSLIVRALQRVGLGTMAAAVANSASEDPNDIAATMAENVKAEAKLARDNDPLVVACEANGITSTAHLGAAMALKGIGERHFADLRGKTKAEAIRAYGSELGPQMSAAVDHLGYDAVAALHGQFQAQADAKFGTSDKPGARQTAANGTVAVSEDEPEAEGRAWDRLDAKFGKGTAAKAQKDYALDTDEKKDAFAAKFFGEAK